MTWTADSTWYLQREPGFWRRKRQAYLDLPPWVGLGRDASPTHEAEAREHLLEVLLTFPVGGSKFFHATSVPVAVHAAEGKVRVLGRERVRGFGVVAWGIGTKSS